MSPRRIKRRGLPPRRLQPPPPPPVIDDAFKRYLEEHDLDDEDDEELRQRIEQMSGEGEPIIDVPEKTSDDDVPELD